MTIESLLQQVIDSNASDLHFTVGAPPTLRISGDLAPIGGTDKLSPTDCENLIFALTNNEQKEILLMNKEVDFSFAFGKKGRFRVNAFHQKGYLAASLRLIPLKVPTIEELNLPKIIYEFCKLPQGFILIAGPTGQGKSTTLAAMLNFINETRTVHIVTIEDPIEFIFPHVKALIDQRELYLDTHSWEIALRSVLREDPNVVLVGEMRDFETIASAITIAETGHLVFSTLHTNSAAQTVDRMIDVFPEHQQQQIRVQLAAILEGVICQRLIPAIDGSRVPAMEIMLVNSAVRNLIREGKTHQIDNVITTSSGEGMTSLERSLAFLVRTGKIDLETAKRNTLRPKELMRFLKG